MAARDRALIAATRIEESILLLRGHKVLLDSTLATLYGVRTKSLNQAVKRNAARFPRDFVFRLTPEEKTEVVTNCDHLARLRFSPNLPYAFSEHGAIMAANLLNSSRAIETSVQVVRAFVRLRQMIATNKELAKRLNELEARYDRQFKAVFDAIRELMTPPPAKPRRRIGFISGN